MSIRAGARQPRLPEDGSFGPWEVRRQVQSLTRGSRSLEVGRPHRHHGEQGILRVADAIYSYGDDSGRLELERASDRHASLANAAGLANVASGSSMSGESSP